MGITTDDAGAQAPAPNTLDGTSSPPQTDQPQQPVKSFGQSKQAAHNLLHALAHDLLVSSTWAKAKTVAAA